ncbi:DUF362 domain-containing protein [bacterium]|nr:DUF362 domain-containing protein [candidate division CSSED10-310 bacterium]
MNRREFLKRMGLWTAGLLAAPPIFSLTRTLAADAPTPRLAVTRGEDHSGLAAKVLEPFGGMEAFVKKGMTVVIKPNIGWDRFPAQAANTNPEIVRAMALLALGAGAAKVMVFDNTCNDERRCYASSGIKAILDAMNDKRVTCDFMDERKFVPVKIQAGRALKEWPLYKDVLDADVLINLPVAKHHTLAKLSLGLKNTMGIMGGNRGRIHRNIGQNLADLATVVRPELTVIDATRILLRNGPVGGNLDDVKHLDTLIASIDPVAADAYATTLFELAPREIDATRAAYEMGLGEIDLNKATIITV